MSDNFSQVIHSHIWQEEPEPDNPFAAARCVCRGYDVYGDLLGKASYIEYLHLLIKGERPSEQTAAALEVLAIALANPGPRDPSVHAAMASGVTGNPASSSLMAALAAGAGSYGGARETLLAMQIWHDCGMDLEAWKTRLATPETPLAPTRPLFWPQVEHAPGFDPHGVRCATPVLQLLDELCSILPAGQLTWLSEHRTKLEAITGIPLAQSGVVAAAFINLDFSPAEGEMLTLLWRLPGAAAHALEQAKRGFRQFPFFELELENDPGFITPKEQT
ncbi:MAG: citryl-CoA lyase [Pseudomonadota bacterium]